jgi:hypothetical protein
MNLDTTKVFLQLLFRDFYVFGKRLKTYGINYLVIYPALAILIFGYVQPGIIGGSSSARVSIILMVGTFALNTLSICYHLLSPFVFDVEGDRFIDYQLTLLPPRLLLFELITFPALFSFIIALPFFPFARLVLPHYFNELNTAWIGLIAMILVSSYFFASYVMLAMCVIKKSMYVRQFWIRCNWPLVILGGFWLPWMMLKKHFPLYSLIALLDPFTYITEGLRSALVGNDQFIAYPICIMTLFLFSIIFNLLSCYFFKQKLDHI